MLAGVENCLYNKTKTKAVDEEPKVARELNQDLKKTVQMFNNKTEITLNT